MIPTHSRRIIYLLVIMILQFHHYSPAQLTLPEKPVSVMDQPVEFTGWKGISTPSSEVKEIRIGLFLPDQGSDLKDTTIIQAAQLAVYELNEKGGFQGIPYRLVSRWAHDPWGAGSREMIRLVYRDSVWAVIGSLDGNSTHIAEQVVTKARVPLFSPLSADPTLNYIRIPWMFRLPPDFSLQAGVIAQQGIGASALTRVGIIAVSDHDGRIFGREMQNQLRQLQIAPVFYFQVPPSETDFREITRRASNYSPQGIILYLSVDKLEAFLSELTQNVGPVPIYIPWIPGVETLPLQPVYPGEIYQVLPFSSAGNPLFHSFTRRFKLRYAASPSCGAAYTYDAIYLVASALTRSGLNRAGLRQAISDTENFQGVTGRISWDNGGGNRSEPILELLSGANQPHLGSNQSHYKSEQP